MTQADNWKPLYRTGAVAALIAALLFRRNIGAEVSLFTGMDAIPTNAAEWFGLLRSNPFVGLSFLAFFDLLNYALVGVILLALAAMLWQINESVSAIALVSGLVGVTLNLVSNISLTMLSLAVEPPMSQERAAQYIAFNRGEEGNSFRDSFFTDDELEAYVPSQADAFHQARADAVLIGWNPPSYLSASPAHIPVPVQ